MTIKELLDRVRIAVMYLRGRPLLGEMYMHGYEAGRADRQIMQAAVKPPKDLN